jgi:uncharacterized protein YkwD
MTRMVPPRPWPERAVRGSDRLGVPVSSADLPTFSTGQDLAWFNLGEGSYSNRGIDMSGPRTTSPRRWAPRAVVITSVVLLAALLAPSGSASGAGDSGARYERAVIAEGHEVQATRTRRTLRLVRVAPSDRAERLREAIFRVTNRRREARGLDPLRPSTCAARFAQRHSTRMVERAELFHANISVLRKRCSVRATAENVAYHSSADVDARSIVKAWMRSPSHRANILDPKLTHLGVGVDQHTGSRAWYPTQDFLRGR